jgi:hypothetical protein
MNIELKLTQATTVVSKSIETIILPEDNLIFNISTDVYDIKTLVVSARNGKKEKQFKVIDFKPLDLTEFLIGGVLQLEISAILKGHVIKTWRVPDITIKEVEHFFMVIPEIERLKMEYNEKFKEVYKALGEIKNIIKGE